MKTLLANLKGLFSNQAIIDNRKQKWYITLIVAILALFLPWIPYLVGGYTTDYSKNFTSSTNYEIDKGFEVMLSENYFKDIKVKGEKNNYYLTYDFSSDEYSDASWDDEYNLKNTKALTCLNYTDKKDAEGVSNYISETDFTNQTVTYYFDNIGIKTDNQIDSNITLDSTTYETGSVTYLEAYFLPTLDLNEDNYSQLLENFVYSVIFKATNDSSSIVYNNYPHSYAIFGKNLIYVAFFPLAASKSTTSPSATYSGNFSLGLTETGYNNEGSLYAFLSKDSTDVQVIYNNSLTHLFDYAARDYGIQSAWLNIALICAIVASGMLVAFGIILFFSKRKTSLYRDIKWYEALNEGIQLTLCPSLIAMIVGFFSSSYLIMVLLAAILFRIVWINNKINPPAEAPSESKPLYKARS